MTSNIATYKELCMQIPNRGLYFKRTLERIHTQEEFQDFCRRKKINISELVPKIREVQVEPTLRESTTEKENLSSAIPTATQQQKPEPEVKKSKEKKRSKGKSSKYSNPGNIINISKSSNVVIGNVQVFNMPVLKTKGMPPKPPNSKP
ncbi:uncharacterized protein LOC134831891 [Culicoides brevitarsis]|uniref:uncharacterized protein LOC134831891 n=1 Tax=Culicoides brevitarsis TaxID=469753 RepID=UPI00307C98E7